MQAVSALHVDTAEAANVLHDLHLTRCLGHVYIILEPQHSQQHKVLRGWHCANH
jgi:hypothetical protein